LPDVAFIKTTHQTLSIGEASTNGQKKIVKEPDVKDRGDTFAVPAEEADQFFSKHPIIYRPTHPKNRTPTGGVSPLSTTPFSEIHRRPVPQKSADMTQMDPKIAPIWSHFGGCGRRNCTLKRFKIASGASLEGRNPIFFYLKRAVFTRHRYSFWPQKAEK
jgi:hypothetical protein